MRTIAISALACLLTLAAAGCVAMPYSGANTQSLRVNETTLRAADAVQAAAVVSGDVRQIRSLMRPNYRVNAPTNRVMPAAEILAMFDKGIIAAEPVERTIEAAVVQGTTGIIMGRESLVPAPGSQLAKASGGQAILRRFTNIYSFESGKWWFMGRHFNQIKP